VISAFDVSSDVPSRSVKTSINRAILLAEGCKGGCEARANVLAELLTQICERDPDSGVNLSTFTVDTVTARDQSLRRSIGSFRGFTYVGPKRLCSERSNSQEEVVNGATTSEE
jgi:hypothetical protein